VPQETNAPRTAEAKARDAVVLAVRRRADHGGERAHGPALGTRQPFRLVLRRGDGGNEPDLCPVEDAAREGRPQPRQALEARAHGREALELARGEAQPLPAIDGGDAIANFEFETQIRLERPKLLRRE